MPRQIHILFNLIALFVISYIVVDTFYKYIGIELHQLAGPRQVVVKETETLGEKSPATRDFKKIVGRNIFGATEKIDEAPVVEIEAIETLEETSLQLSLLGTIAGDSESARAIILDKRQRSQDLYRVGDSVQEAEIRQILRGKVILRHNDKDEILTMVEGDDKPHSASARKTSRSSRSNVVPSRRSATRPVPARAEVPQEVETETITIAQSEIQDSISDLSQLMTQVRVRPYFRRGKPEGLIVSQIQANSLFSKLGIVNGDIISTVNGQQISSPDDAFQFYNNLKSGGEVDIEITRRGQKKIISYNIQ
jgi:general secretion pathway protein C